MKRTALAFLTKLDDRVYHNMAIFSQFTIDFVENFRSDLEDSIENDPEGMVGESEEREFFRAMSYNTENIIDICKEGHDRELFVELNSFLEELTNEK